MRMGLYLIKVEHIRENYEKKRIALIQKELSEMEDEWAKAPDKKLLNEL